MFEPIFECIQHHFGNDRVGLHEPLLGDVEKEYLSAAIDSGFVSTAGEMVEQFETQIAERVQAKYCVALVNGTAALQLGLLALGVKPNDEVLTQSLTFIATANAIHHCGAEPVFIDVDSRNIGMSTEALAHWLCENVTRSGGLAINRSSGRVIRACVPMHTHGMAVEIDSIRSLCSDYGIALMEDSAEALGSSYRGQALGTYGDCGVYSFNGNKVITTGGGGALVTNDEQLACRVRHLSTTAKIDAYRHDSAAFNFRMPNLNAALGCAQLTRLDDILHQKKQLASDYQAAIDRVSGASFFTGLEHGQSNFWLSSILWDCVESKEAFIEEATKRDIQTRSVWQLLHLSLPYHHCQTGDLSTCEAMVDRVLSLPSMPVGR